MSVFEMLQRLFFSKLFFSFAEGDANGGGGDGEGGKKKEPPAGANQQPTVEELQANLKKLQDEKAELEKEKKGIYGDLKSEQERRRELEKSIQQKKQEIEDEKDLLSELGDDDYITAKHLKNLRASEQAKSRAFAVQQLEMRGQERMADDEYRMQELTELNPKKYPVSYDEAIEAFTELAKKDQTLWEEVDRAKYRPGGRPAEAAYKIALREHPKFQDLTKKKVREEIIDELHQQEGRPKRISSGGGRGTKSLENMSEQEIMELSDADLEKALRG